jgi:capsular exopolysaccharide synthesis family protein
LLAVIVALPVAVMAACVTWALQPVLYTATAILRMSAQEATLIFETADNRGSGNNFEIYKRTQRQLLKSRFVVTRALRDESLAKLPSLQNQRDPADWLELNVAVVFPDESELMFVSLTADGAEGLHQLLNGVVKAYFDEVVFAERNRKLERLNSLELAYKKAEVELRAKRTDLKQLVERVGSADAGALTVVQQNTLQQYASYQQKYAQLRFELIEAQGELELAEATATAQDDSQITISDHEMLLAMRADRECERIRAEKQQALDHIKAVRGALKEGIAQQKVAESERRLENYDLKLEARKVALRSELADYKRQYAASEIDELKRRVALLAGQEKLWQTKAHELEAEARQMGRSSIDVEMMRAEINALQEISSRLGSEAERSRVELQPDSKGSGARVTLLAEAGPARAADSKPRWSKALGAGIVGLFLPAVFIVFLDIRKSRVNGSQEISQALGLNVVGSVPLVPPRIMQHLDGPSAKHLYWRTLLSESVDSIAAVLLRGAKRNEMRVLMVSSATAGEGKTTLAANLATSIASTGVHTILVDFDLRRPALHRVFDRNLQPGINDVLRDPESLHAAIQYTEIPRLAFLPAGRWSEMGLASLAAADLKSLIDRLRTEYQFVVIDASPILPIVDTRLIAQNVDTVILSVLRDVSRIPQVRAACDLLEKFSVPIFGVVVTGSKGDAYPDSTYDSYYLKAKVV